MLMTGAHQLQRTVQKRAREELPTPKVRGGNREHQAAMAQEWPREATPLPRSGVVAERSYPMPEVRGGGRKELPHAGGQGQRLRRATSCPRRSDCTLLEQP